MNKNRTYAQVSLGAIAHNYHEIRKQVQGHKVLCIVKADAYGHGAVRVASMLQQEGADYFAVATADEAVELRLHGIETPILILGYVEKDDVYKILAYHITVPIYDYETAKIYSDAAIKAGKKIKIHIKVDTGMTRLGFQTTDMEQCLSEIQRAVSLEGLETEGLFTHFAISDETKGKEYTAMQLKRFQTVSDGLEKAGIPIPIRHCANSGAILQYPDTYFDMVRAGIILYGYYPDHTTEKTIDLRPAMTVKAHVIQVRDVPAGTAISYGGTYVTEKDISTAVISMGYADGYLRTGSNRAKVWIRGHIVPVIGRICMDMCMVDITGLSDIKRDDEVVIFGDGPVNADTVAEAAGTIPYEVLCAVSFRIPRFYED